MSVRIFLAKNIGFCPGTKRAKEIADVAIGEKSAKVFMLGPLVHNKRVMADFLERGVKVIKSLKGIPQNSLLIISAHGIGPKIKEKIKNSKIKIIDTTCPWVLNIQKLAEKLAMAGYYMILVGDKKHREVKGIREFGKGKVIVISKIKEAEKFVHKSIRFDKLAVFSQTTQNEEIFRKIAKILRDNFPQIKIFNTICPASKKRQKEAKKMAEENNLIIVIGSKNSANSKRLFKISKKINKGTYFVAASKELKESWFRPEIRKIGIISGASTPLETVKEIKEKIESFIW